MTKNGVIYAIKNNINGNMYIGQTNELKRRIKEHIRHNKTVIEKAITKYGIDKFSIKILEKCNVEELNKKEKYYIDKYNTYEKGYNCTLGGEGLRGYSITEDHRRKMKENHADVSGENNPMYGVKLTGENNHFYGKNHSKKTKNKISKTRKEKGIAAGSNNPMFGKNHSEKTISKMRKAKKGKYLNNNNPNAKVDKKRALEIYDEYENNNISQADLAKKHKLSKGLIWQIVVGKHWTTKHLKQKEVLNDRSNKKRENTG